MQRSTPDATHHDMVASAGMGYGRVTLVVCTHLLAAGCSLLGLFDAAPADFCEADADCLGIVAGECGQPSCEDGICVALLHDTDEDGHAPVACADVQMANLPADDCNDADPARWMDHADLDGDGHADFRCAGGDCDDDDASAHPGGERDCSAARDHDCDGVVDPLEACTDCQPGAARVVGAWTGGDPKDVFVVGELAVVVLYDAAAVLDVADPATSREIGRIDLSAYAECRSVSVHAATAFVGCDSSVVRVSLEDPSDPRVLGDLAVEGPIYGITRSFGRLWMAGNSAVLYADDLPAPTLGGRSRDWGTVWDVFSTREHVYAAAHEGLLIFDALGAGVVELGRPVGPEAAVSLSVEGDRAYVVARPMPGDPGVASAVIDLTDRASPVVIGEFGSGINDAVVRGGYLYLLRPQLQIVSLTPDGIPETTIATLDTPGSRLFVTDELAYVLGADLTVVDLGCQ